MTAETEPAQHHPHHSGADHAHAQAHQPHPRQPDLEDQPFDYHQLMAEAIGELLIEKGVFAAADLRRTIEAIDARSPADGARLVARAWLDEAFKTRLLQDVNAAALEFGIEAGTIPIRALENTPSLHNLVVCTLCSCYPRGLLGLPPDWYKARAYRSRAIRAPRTVLAELGTELPEAVEIRVHDSTADLRYLVLPMRPPGTGQLGEAALAALVTRDCMIGTAVPCAPSA